MKDCTRPGCPGHDPTKCKAHTTKGHPCKKPPIRGGTVCSTHGGTAQQVRRKAQQRLALQKARDLALGIADPDITPEEAIIDLVREAAGNVELYRTAVAELELEEGSAYVRTGSVSKPNEAEPHVLVRMYDAERSRLLQYAKVAAELGISERLVRIAEQRGELFARVVNAALSDDRLGLSAEQKRLAPGVIAGYLREAS